MAIVLNAFSRTEQWIEQLTQLLPNDDLRVWPEVGAPEDVEYVIAWVMPRSALAAFTNLKAILSLAAGTEQWQKPGMPDVPVVRLADPSMANEMAGYALAWVIRHQRRFADAEKSQRAGEWEIPPYTQPWEYRIGILGYGMIGARIGSVFADLDYQVNAWSRSGGSDEAVSHFKGLDELDDFLGASDAVINVLPSTPETQGLLDAERFSKFVPDSVFVNIGRGTVIADEADLIQALDCGPLGAAVLDVSSPEPPAADSPLFGHPDITLTAHLAGMTQVKSAALLIADNIVRLRRGEPPFPLLDRARGY